MGQYLATGIVTQMSVSKQKPLKYNISIEDIIRKIENEFYFKIKLYEMSETDEYYTWTLKQSIIEKELKPFLESFLYQIHNDTEDVNKVIESLENNPPEKWIELAESKSLYYFQQDNYAEDIYLYFRDRDFRPNIKLHCSCIMLSNEGKIIMEEYGRQFNFFKYCMTKTFAEFEISSALRIYITG